MLGFLSGPIQAQSFLGNMKLSGVAGALPLQCTKTYFSGDGTVYIIVCLVLVAQNARIHLLHCLYEFLCTFSPVNVV